MENMKKMLFLAFCLGFFQLTFAEKKTVIIPEGTTISLKINKDIKVTAKMNFITATVEGDVYDESGEYVVIEDGASTEMRVTITKKDFWGSGDPGRITLTPTSVETVTGRTIALKEKWFTIENSKIKAGTPFTTYTSKDIKLVIEL